MGIAELKKSIHKKVDDTNDRELLELVDLLVNRQGETYIIPEHMKEGIAQGMTDLKNGDTFTMEDFEKKYEQWLKQ